MFFYDIIAALESISDLKKHAEISYTSQTFE